MSEENRNNDPSFDEKEDNTEKIIQDDSSVSNDMELDIDDSVLFAEDGEDQRLPHKKEKRVSLTAFLFTCISLVMVAIMITYTCCSGYYRKKMADQVYNSANAGIANGTADLDIASTLDLLGMVFDQLSIIDYDKEAMMNAVFKAYVRASGDQYAEYYTPEEYNMLIEQSKGKNQGIGINIIQSSISINKVEYTVIKVINVHKGSPAAEAGVKVNDYIIYAGVGDDKQLVDALGYDAAVSALQGVADTEAKFVVWREKDGGGYDEIPFTIMRKEYTAYAVSYDICELDNGIGIVKIDSFDLTTPSALREAIDTLKNEKGCDRFVFDVRYNPGGDLKSIEAVLSYFLNEGDTIIKTKDKSGAEEVSVVKAVEYSGNYAPCSVTQEQIGMYRDLNFVVLCNGNTASAAELFTAALRDNGLGTIVGTTTYGKGSMQSTIPLQSGAAIKLTTRMYYPPSGVSYEGIGITPHVIVELSEEAEDYNIYDLPHEIDNQLVEAIKHFK